MRHQMSQFIEEILYGKNMTFAYKRGKKQIKSASGIDGICISEINEYLKANLVEICKQTRKRKHTQSRQGE